MSITQPVFINGEWIKLNKNPRPILNPANLTELAITADCGVEEVNAAVQAAKNSQKNWWRVSGVEKSNLLRGVARKLREMEAELAELLTKETGKPLIESYDCVDWVAACFDYYAEVGRRSIGNSIPPVAPHQINFTVKEPYGVVAAIAPFNFPLLLMAWKVAPALAAGNTVVCKPPHQNPLSTLLMAKAFSDLPAGVVNVITGDGVTGDELIRHPDIDLIAFTGSTVVGRQVARLAGENLKKVNLELGGIDPALVFADADLDVAVQGVAWARLLNAGQVCTSPKRIYVVKDIADEFIERVVKYVKNVRVGDPMNPDTEMGPLISHEAALKVQDQVDRAIAEGAKLVCGGKMMTELKGHYFQPTVLVNVQHGSLLTQEEVFGPVLSIIVAKDADDAIRMANDSAFGLGASIFTKSLELTMKAMENIKAGTFWVNDPLTDNEAAPFGGMRASGVGRELGEEGLDAFREPKHVHIDYVMEKKSFWFPYGERTREKLNHGKH